MNLIGKNLAYYQNSYGIGVIVGLRVENELISTLVVRTFDDRQIDVLPHEFQPRPGCTCLGLVEEGTANTSAIRLRVMARVRLRIKNKRVRIIRRERVRIQSKHKGK